MIYKLVLIILFSLINASLFANISIDKKYLLFDKNTKENQITITNTSNKNNWYEVSFVYLKQSKYGTYSKETKSDLMLGSQYFNINNARFFLKKGDDKTIKINNINTQSLNNELNLHLYIKEVQNNQENINDDNTNFDIKITPRFAITIPVVLRANNMDEKANIGNIKFIKDKNNPDNVKILINLTRTSSASIRLNLIIESENEVISTINGLNILLSTTQREVLIDLGSIKENNLEQKLKKTLNITIVNANNNIIMDKKIFAWK
jgi:hypothetical protein